MKQLMVGIVLGAVTVAALGSKSTPPGASGLIAAHAADAGDSSDSSRCSRQEEAANKALLFQFKPGSTALYESMAPDYYQHNPEYLRFGELNGVSGRKTVELMDKLRLGLTGRRSAPPVPGQPPTNFTYRILAECDFALQVVQSWHPDPLSPGKFYATYMFNLWRMKNGKLLEHWDPDGMPDPVPEYLKVPMKDLNQRGSAEKATTG